jgi:DNA-binding transcriptional MerR regulator
MRMRIGELAARADVSTRRLRYYEQCGLLRPDRDALGHRDYPESAVRQVAEIRGLVDSGVPLRLVARILSGLAEPGRAGAAPPELVADLARHRDLLDARIRCLVRNRDALTGYLDRLTDGG